MLRRLVVCTALLALAACADDPSSESVTSAPSTGAAPDRARTRATPASPTSGANEPEGSVPPGAPDGAAWTSGHTEDADLAQRLADPASSPGAEAELEQLADERRIDVWRTGLRMAGAPAVLAAQRLEWWHLDAWESRRVVELLVPIAMDEEADVDTEALRSVLGSGELAALFAEMRARPGHAGETQLLGALHRQLRAEHLPVLVEMALSGDELLASQAFEEIAIVIAYTDRGRRDVARIFAGRAERPEPPGALPPELVVAIRALQAGRGTGTHLDGYFVAWAMRWLDDVERPVEADVPVLLEVLERAEEDEDLFVQGHVLLALGRAPGPAARDALAARADVVSDSQITAVAARARQGDAASKDTLVRLAQTDSVALALTLHLDARHLRLVAEAMTSGDAAAFDRIDDAFTERWMWGLDWDDAALRQAVAGAVPRTPPRLLLLLAARFPHWRTRAVAESVVARLGDVLADPPEDFLDVDLPFLELGAGDALVAGLRTATAPDAEVVDAYHEAARAALARLRPSAERGPVPRRVLADLRYHVDDADDEHPARAPLAAGDHVEAVLAFLRAEDGVELDGVGRIDDARVRGFLRAESRKRSGGRAHWALGELAVAGDPAAQEALRDIVAAGRYRWVDNASGLALTSGGDPATLPFWIDEAESNCCRVIPVKRVFEEVAGTDLDRLFPLQSGRGTTLVEWLRWWWEETGGVRWSNAADGLVPAVR